MIDEADLAALPAAPGVYLMKDAEGTVLYVGKAAVLRSRVRSYFQAGSEHTYRTQAMVQRVASVETIVTGSEIEALILEANLVEQHQPRYNVRLRDDKAFPFLKLTAEPFPQLVDCRRVENDGAQYFGPFTDAGAMRQTDKLLRRLFKIRSCTFALTGEAQMRPCLDYHIGLCEAPCAAYVDREHYQAGIARAAEFLRGRPGDVIEQLETEMQEAAENLEFERAAKLRDLIADAQHVLAGQRIVSTRSTDADVVAVAQHEDLSCVQAFFVRRGKVVGDHRVMVEGTQDDTAGVALKTFLTSYYDQSVEVPPAVLLAGPVPDAETIAAWLSQKAGRRVVLEVPERGPRRELVELVEQNAGESMRLFLVDRDQQRQRAEAATADLRERLDLPRTPFRIECFDIATLQGEQNVGSMVVFEDGRPLKKAYRRFKIRQEADAPDDYAMMREVLDRRLRNGIAGDPKFVPLPDLLVVDGGKGQLNVAVDVCRTLDLQQIPLAALAKRHEQVFRPGRSEPIVLDARMPAIRLLRAIRDEAHRFANTYHQRLRRGASLRSILDDIPGIGAVRRTRLLAHFRSTEAIAAASIDEIAALPGMNRPAAERVKAHLAGDSE